MHQALAYSLRPIAIAALSVALISVASAQQSDPKVKRQRSYTTPSHQTAKPQPVARPRTTTSCSEFGAGFVRMPGSDSCIRVGGSIGAGVGMSR